MKYWSNIIVLICITGSLSLSSERAVFIPSELVVKCKEEINGILSVKPCPVPVTQLRKGRLESGHFGPIRTTPPPWYNKTLAMIGQNFLNKNLGGYSIAQVFGFILQSTSTDFRRVFLSTGNSSNSIQSSKRRYLSTYLFALQQARGKMPEENLSEDDYNNDVPLDFEEEINFISVYNSLRFIHENVNYETLRYSHYLKNPIIPEPNSTFQNPKNLNLRVWNAFEKDIYNSKFLSKYRKTPLFPPKTGSSTPFYFNQFGMAIEYWALVGPIILFPEKIFMRPSPMEQLAYLHYYGVAGYVLGLKNEYNICLQPSLKEAKKYYMEMLEEYLLPGLFNLDYETKVLAEMVIKGLNEIVKIADLATILCEFLFMLDVPSPNLRRVLTPQGRIYSQALRIGQSLTHYPFYRSITTNVVHGLVQAETMKEFGINIFQTSNFTTGFIELSEDAIKYAKFWNLKIREKNAKLQQSEAENLNR